MSSTLLAGVLLIIGNVLADILLTWVDPRIRYEKKINHHSRTHWPLRLFVAIVWPCFAFGLW